MKGLAGSHSLELFICIQDSNSNNVVFLQINFIEIYSAGDDYLHMRSSVVAPLALSSSIALSARRLSSFDTAATVRLFCEVFG